MHRQHRYTQIYGVYIQMSRRNRPYGTSSPFIGLIYKWLYFDVSSFYYLFQYRNGKSVRGISLIGTYFYRYSFIYPSSACRIRLQTVGMSSSTFVEILLCHNLMNTLFFRGYSKDNLNQLPVL